MFNLTENNEPRKIAKTKKNYYRYFFKLFGQKLKIKNHKILMKYEIKKTCLLHDIHMKFRNSWLTAGAYYLLSKEFPWYFQKK